MKRLRVNRLYFWLLAYLMCGSVNAQPVITLDIVSEWCSAKPVQLITKPGKVTAEMPAISNDTLDATISFQQTPEIGTILEPGEYQSKVIRSDTGDVVCERPIHVALDTDSAAWPEFEYIPAGDNGIALVGSIPVIETAALEDELGNPIALNIFVDGYGVQGSDLSPVSALFSIPGFHTTTVQFVDSFGRSAEFFWSEWFHEALAFSGNENIALGVQLGCHCELVVNNIDSTNCSVPGVGTGTGKANYSCAKSNISNMSMEVTDRWGNTDSHTAADGSSETKELKIVCKTQNGTVQPVCTTCCPTPVIIATHRIKVGALKAFAEDGTDSATLGVTLAGSGLGKFEVGSGIASGFQNFEYESGVTLGGEIGVGAVDKAMALMPKLTASSSEKKKYSGDAYGWKSAKPIPNTMITGWSKSCSAQHALSASFAGDVLADVDDWEQFFGITSDKSEVLMSSASAAVITVAVFRCDGKTPEVGQN